MKKSIKILLLLIAIILVSIIFSKSKSYATVVPNKVELPYTNSFIVTTPGYSPNYQFLCAEHPKSHAWMQKTPETPQAGDYGQYDMSVYTTGARGRIESLLFYCSSTSKENAFQNFMNNTYINKAIVANSGCVRANDFVS